MSFEPNKKPWWLGVGFVISILCWLVACYFIFVALTIYFEK